jgi:hypothetical protein
MMLPPGFDAVVAVAAGAVRHAGWWLEWHARPDPGCGSRDLSESSLVAEAAPCASSS